MLNYFIPLFFMNNSTHNDNLLKGAGLIAISVLMIAGMNATSKWLSVTMHPIELTFYRNIIILVGFLAWFHLSQNWHLAKTNNPKDQLYRAFVGTCGNVLAFWAISKLPLADATVLLYTSPLFVILLSYPILGERVSPWKAAAIFLGFCGIIFVAQPSGSGLSWDGIALALAGALFHALTQMQLRKLGKDENPLTTVFYFMLLGSIMTGIFIPFVGSGVPSFDAAPFLLLLAATGILQQVFKTVGYSLAPTASLTPINYTGLIWAILFGFVFWQEVPSLAMLAGAGIIIGANLFILWREQKFKKAIPMTAAAD